MVPRSLWLQGHCLSGRASLCLLAVWCSVSRKTFSLPTLDVFCVELGVYSHVWPLFLNIQLLLVTSRGNPVASQDTLLQHFSRVCFDEALPDLCMSRGLTGCLRKKACSLLRACRPHGWVTSVPGLHRPGHGIPSPWDGLSLPARAVSDPPSARQRRCLGDCVWSGWC